MTLVRLTAILLVLGAINLALMIPGGFVETRSFPGYNVSVLVVFNVFLTLLGFGSLVLAYRVFRTGRAGLLSVGVGAAYSAVYLLDLAHIFPISAAPMSATLTTMERIGVVIGLATMVVGLWVVYVQGNSSAHMRKLPLWMVVSMGALTLIIVVFATLSAL